MFFITIRMATVVIILAAIVCLAFFSFSISSEDGALYNRFFGNKSFEGIVNLWNVDTFEGGSLSREVFLQEVAASFEKQHKGTLIKVENMNVNEMLANIRGGVYPDIFCFGTGVGGYLKELMQPLADAKNLLQPFYFAGHSGGKFLAAAWSFGGYALISSQSRIEAASGTDAGLKEQALSLAFDKVGRKKTTHIFSLTFGGNDYTNALDCFSREFPSANLGELEGAVDPSYKSQSTYNAYECFIAGKSSVLLGTQRDIFRMENRVRAGKEDGVIVEPLMNFTDLVSYVSVTAKDKEVAKVGQDFVSFLLSGECQKKLAEIGLLSPTGQKLYASGGMALMERAVSEKIVVKQAI